MRFLFLCYCAFSMCVTLVSSARLREEKKMRLVNQLAEAHPRKIDYQNAVGGFPSSPTYAVMEFYNNPGCNGYTGGISYVLNTCLASAYSSTKYVCSNGYLTVYDYSDTTCGTLMDSTHYPPTGDCMDTDDDSFSAIVSACGTSDPFDYGLSVIIQSLNQDSFCQDVVGTLAYKNGMCMPLFPYQSVKLKWPYLYLYYSIDCSGPVVDKEVFPTICNAPDAYSAYDDIQYNAYSMYTFVGSESSSFSTRRFGFGIVLPAVVAAILQLIKK